MQRTEEGSGRDQAPFFGFRSLQQTSIGPARPAGSRPASHPATTLLRPCGIQAPLHFTGCHVDFARDRVSSRDHAPSASFSKAFRYRERRLPIQPETRGFSLFEVALIRRAPLMGFSTLRSFSPARRLTTRFPAVESRLPFSERPPGSFPGIDHRFAQVSAWPTFLYGQIDQGRSPRLPGISCCKLVKADPAILDRSTTAALGFLLFQVCRPSEMMRRKIRLIFDRQPLPDFVRAIRSWGCDEMSFSIHSTLQCRMNCFDRRPFSVFGR